MEINVRNGQVKYKEETFGYTYDKSIITLIPQGKMEYDFSRLFKEARQKKQEVNIYGTTEDNHPIVFLKLKLDSNSSGVLKAYVPAYIVCHANVVSPLPKISNFNYIKFFGEAVDNLYNPRQLISSYNILDEWTPTIEFEQKKHTVKDFMYDGDKYILGTNGRPTYPDEKNYIIELYSYLQIKFKKVKNIEDLL